MRKIVLSIIVSCLALSLGHARGQSSFAIFVDEQTYLHCQKELEQYRQVLIDEGLSTEIYHSDWASPEQVKEIILRLGRQKRRPLEGAVFVGQVPIVMVRGGQHLTTAFKMNEERYPMQESSVASDRYYDDFDLSFEFIARDSIDTCRFFYRLTSDGAQTLRPEIYTGRIKVPKFMIKHPGDEYELISKYLLKAVEAHKENNVLDHMCFFYGSGYNSEDMNVWREKIFASYEEFPYTKGRAEQHRFLNFHQEEQSKWTLFSELQRPKTDFFQFSEHGAPSVQYINGGKERPSASDYIDELRLSILNGKRARTVLDSLAQHINPSFLSDSAKAVLLYEDSLRTRHKDIYQEEIAAIHSNPRVVILNACYNNSFHNPEGYVAGAHIFSPGRCVVSQGNTVNVLQDKYENKLVGLLSLGVRVGLWQKEVSYLESHLAGDPTFRFTPASEDKALAETLAKALVHKPYDQRFWKKYLSSDNPIVRSTAVVHLGYCGYTEGFMDILSSDASCMVRMSALDALLSTEQREEALLLGLKDPYELILRQSVKAACKWAAVGKDSLICHAVRHLGTYHTELPRLSYYISNYERLISPIGTYYEELQTLLNSVAKLQSRINAARYYRNNNYIPAIEGLVSMISDSKETLPLRLVCAEALGWYEMSSSKAEIISRLTNLDTASYPEELKSEITKTIKRLEYK